MSTPQIVLVKRESNDSQKELWRKQRRDNSITKWPFILPRLQWQMSVVVSICRRCCRSQLDEWCWWLIWSSLVEICRRCWCTLTMLQSAGWVMLVAGMVVVGREVSSLLMCLDYRVLSVLSHSNGQETDS